MIPLVVTFGGVVGLGFLAGLAIGCVGIGGIIIVPVLVQGGGMVASSGIAVAIAGYIVTGAIGTWSHVKQGTLALEPARYVCLAAAPTAIAGSFLTATVPTNALMLSLAAMSSLSGIHALAVRPRDPGVDQPSATLSAGKASVLGAVAGFLSALTGTGGPAVLLPLLLWCDLPTITALGLAQVVQLPIAGFATAVNIARGEVDVPMSLLLGLGLLVGGWFGAKLTRRLHAGLLRGIIAGALILGGLAIAAKQILFMVAGRV